MLSDSLLRSRVDNVSDEEVYGEDVNVFRPGRFLDSNDGDGPELPHATYGFGEFVIAPSTNVD